MTFPLTLASQTNYKREARRLYNKIEIEKKILCRSKERGEKAGKKMKFQLILLTCRSHMVHKISLWLSTHFFMTATTLHFHNYSIALLLDAQTHSKMSI